MVPALMVFLLSGVLISVSVGKYAKVQAREKLTSDSESAAHEVMEAMAVRQALAPSTILGVWLADTDSSQLFQPDGFISDPGWDVTSRPILCYPDTEQAGKSISEINISDEVSRLCRTDCGRGTECGDGRALKG